MWIVVWILVVLALVVSIVGVLLLLPVRIALAYSRMNGDDQGHVEIRYLLGLMCWRRQLKKVEIETTSSGVVAKVQSSAAGHSSRDGRPSKSESMSWTEIWRLLRDLPEWLSLFRRLQPIVSELLARTAIERLACRTRFGTGEVITTGMAHGALWAVVGPVITYLSTHVGRLVQPQVAIESDFQRSVFQVDLDCIMEVRAGHFIVAGLRVIRLWKRRTSHGSPDSRTHADSHVEHP